MDFQFFSFQYFYATRSSSYFFSLLAGCFWSWQKLLEWSGPKYIIALGFFFVVLDALIHLHCFGSSPVKQTFIHTRTRIYRICIYKCVILSNEFWMEGLVCHLLEKEFLNCSPCLYNVFVICKLLLQSKKCSSPLTSRTCAHSDTFLLCNPVLNDDDGDVYDTLLKLKKV